MKIKAVSLLLILAIAAALLAGCGGAKPAANETTKAVDAVTTASIVNTQDAFLKAVSKDGTWIIATLGDLTVDKEIVVEGDFHDKNDAANPLYRKIAPYTQDADHKITARFTITAPKMTVKSENCKLQGGTFKGDVYVEANGFNLADAKVDGNVYFASDAFKSTFVLGEGSSVTGATEVKQ